MEKNILALMNIAKRMSNELQENKIVIDDFQEGYKEGQQVMIAWLLEELATLSPATKSLFDKLEAGE